MTLLVGRVLDPAVLLDCLHAPRWAAAVAAGAPYPHPQALLAACDAAAAGPAGPTDAEVLQAVAAHPRIGEPPSGTGRGARFSRAEQQAAGTPADAALAGAVADGNAAYEARFGRVFIVRAAGRDRAAVLAELHRRLRLDPVAELDETRRALLEIARLRLADLARHAPGAVQVSTHVLATDTGRPAVGLTVTVHGHGADGPGAAGAGADGPGAAGTRAGVIARAVTDGDGRVGALLPDGVPGQVLTVVFDTAGWCAGLGRATLYPEVAVTVDLSGHTGHTHVPLLFGPYSYTTYRGS